MIQNRVEIKLTDHIVNCEIELSVTDVREYLPGPGDMGRIIQEKCSRLLGLCGLHYGTCQEYAAGLLVFGHLININLSDEEQGILRKSTPSKWFKNNLQ